MLDATNSTPEAAHPVSARAVPSDHCPRCDRPTHATESNDEGICIECLGPAAIFPEPLSARTVLAAAPMTWQRVEYADAPDALIVEVSVRHYRSPGKDGRRSSYLLTSTVEIDPAVWTICRTKGPQLSPTDVKRLCDDVQRACESGVGVRYRGIALEAA